MTGRRCEVADDKRIIGTGMVPIEPAEPVTRDMEVITELLSRLHAEHRALTRTIAGAGLDVSVLGQRSGWTARRSGSH